MILKIHKKVYFMTKIKVTINLNQDGLGGGKLISLADDAVKLPFTIRDLQHQLRNFLHIQG